MLNGQPTLTIKLIKIQFTQPLHSKVKVQLMSGPSSAITGAWRQAKNGFLNLFGETLELPSSDTLKVKVLSEGREELEDGAICLSSFDRIDSHEVKTQHYILTLNLSAQTDIFSESTTLDIQIPEPEDKFLVAQYRQTTPTNQLSKISI